MPEYIDAHAHVNFSAYDEDREAVVNRALDQGVWMINVGTQETTSQKAVELTRQYSEGVYAIVGLHPIHTDASYHDTDELGEENKPFTSRGEVFDTSFYRELLKEPKVVGIGECGLDYYRTTPETRDKQEQAFAQQIELAIEMDVPLMIHTRPERNSMQAYRDTLDILESYSKEHGEKLRGNFHFFAGNKEIAKRVLDLGFTCSFTGVVTFAEEYNAVIAYLPLERMLIETDCPYVTPEPHRGKRNEPLYVREIVPALARVKELEEEQVRQQVLHNTTRLFSIQEGVA